MYFLPTILNNSGFADIIVGNIGFFFNDLKFKSDNRFREAIITIDDIVPDMLKERKSQPKWHLKVTTEHRKLLWRIREDV